jgi:drug/metabolite transporter (DMT)-like permease
MSTPAVDPRGLTLVFGSALMWSFGGSIARYISIEDSWTVMFWRGVWASAFLLAFLLVRDGPRGTLSLFRNIGWPGLAVAACFGIASGAYVVALAHTTVANILLIQAGVPLIAALLGWGLFREQVQAATWIAIGAVIAGVAVMVSDSFGGGGSPFGSFLAMVIALSFAISTVLTRRFAHVRMTPACCVGMLFTVLLAATQAGGLAVDGTQMALLFAFGAINLGVGMALFVTGVRLVPAAIAALVGTLEPVLGPIFVWLIHGETPSARVILGGAIVIVGLTGHLGWQFFAQRRVNHAESSAR